MRNITLYILLGLATLLPGCQKQSHDEHSMQGMSMADEANSKQLSTAVAQTNRKVISSQAVIKPTGKFKSDTIRAYGYISLDERRSNQVPARVSGRIENLYVKYENQYVRRGDKILDLYSIDLNADQEELLYLNKVEPEGEIAKHAAHKLKLLGVTDGQIKQIIASGKPLFTLSINSIYNGYIFYSPSASKTAMTSSVASNKMGGGMSAGAVEKQQVSSWMGSTSGAIREGVYVSAGQTLFWINDLSEVWGILSVDNQHQNELAVGDSVTVVSELEPEKPIKTVVRFIEPQYATSQKFIQIRVYLQNRKNSLRINSLLEATIYPQSKVGLTLPTSSIMYLGSRQAVWKRVSDTKEGNHIFEIQFVMLGPASKGRVAVLSGLGADDEVALDAGYLMDRESLVKPE
ncbi:efflux RND transporter periplasmic adaptor subunit [soil metagenome]